MSTILTALSTYHVPQAIIIGAVLAYLTAQILMNLALRASTTTVNGWSIATRAGQPGNGVLLRAAFARTLPGVNVIEEAAYWTTTRDGSGQALRGQRDYLLHFPAGHLPPNDAFWSLTMNDLAGFMEPNAINRSSVGSRSGLAPNADGSVDIYIQRAAPTGHEPNWLPAPAGGFKLMLRAYLPGHAVLDGEYRVPPVTRVR